MKKRILAVILTFATCILMLPPKNSASALVFTPNCTVSSEAAVLLNMDIGEIVYEKNADMKEMPAYLTQVMTAVIALESCPKISEETITGDAELFAPLANYENQGDLRYAEIDAGDTLTVEDLLYAMMLTSSVEASLMLANHFGGSEDAFVEKMNEKASQLGMTSTRFTNATGLYSARQVTTARDMMKLLQYAMTVSQFETISCASNYTPATAESVGKQGDWAWEHSNPMSNSESEYYCAGVRGIKTGTLREGGRNICCKAARDGNNYLLVCLNAPLTDAEGNSNFFHLEDVKNIFEWAFAHLTYQKLLGDNDEIDEVQVANADGNDFVIVKPEQGFSCIWCDTADMDSIQQIVTLDENVQAPVKTGDKLGTISLKLSGETLAEVNLVAASSVERSLWKYNVSLIPGFFRSSALGKALKTALLLSILYVGACIFFFARYKTERKRRKQNAGKEHKA
ncbi:MAG: serine hydrolase [Oscillospiraceae bacterium]|nr:serine hydrolase [Oscillospiraceae bacterium]